MYFQANSFYGLLDVESIQSPRFTGKYMQLPYFPGHCYAAVKTKDSNQVLSKLFFQYPKVLNVQGPNYDSSKRKTTVSDLPHSQFSCSGPEGIHKKISFQTFFKIFLDMSVLFCHIWNCRQNLVLLLSSSLCSL